MRRLIITASILFLSSLELFAQKYSVVRDTSYFINNRKSVEVVHNYIAHYYYLDTVCLQMICYPQISGLSNKNVEISLNHQLSSLFHFGGCEGDKECELPPVKFAPAKAYYQLAKVHYIKNDLMSLITTQGNCYENQNVCIQEPHFVIMDLKSGLELSPSNIFKKDVASQNDMEWLIVEQLNFIPSDPDCLIEEISLFFDENYVYFFYAKGIFENEESMTFKFPYNKVAPYINQKSPFARLFKKHLLEKPVEKQIMLIEQ